VNIPKKHVAALIAIVAAWLAVAGLAAKVRDAVGGRLGGAVGLLVAALGTAIIAIIVNSAIRREEAAEREKKRVNNYAAALTEAWKTKEEEK